MTEIDPIPLLTFEQARHKLSISQNLLRSLVHNQEISFILLGHRRIMFTEQAIKEYLERRTVKAKPIVETATPHNEVKLP